MSKSLLVVVGVVAAAVVGYVAYMSYFAAKANIGKDSVSAEDAVENKAPDVPKTAEQKLDALNTLAPASAPAGANNDAKEKLLENAAALPKNDTIPAEDADKIRLLESLKK